MRSKFLSQSSKYAFSLKMINFRKNADCPASPDLLAFQNGETQPAETAFIRRHLLKCEFCAAEVELYARFPQSDEECAETEIPSALYELAEALLNNKQKNFSLLNKLLEVESIKI
ncbi:MAG: hypothetical protein ACR2GD_07130 [Pyrinomonadaceae bacterium]